MTAGGIASLEQGRAEVEVVTVMDRILDGPVQIFLDMHLPSRGVDVRSALGYLNRFHCDVDEVMTGIGQVSVSADYGTT